MRALLLSLALIAAPAFAQPAPERPKTPAPAAAATIEQRQDWCEKYANWLIMNEPPTALPSDARPTQRFETEFASCKLDPRQYERETRAEADRIIADS